MDHRLLLAILLVGLVGLCMAEENKGEGSTDMANMEGNSSMEKGKKNSGLEQLYMMVMMVKAFFSMIFGIISPIIQIKGFFLSVIGTIVNIARLVLTIQKQAQEKKPHGGMAWASSLNRRYVTPPPHLHSIYYANFRDDDRRV